MTLAEMVAQYGEAEVVRWAETGRRAEASLRPWSGELTLLSDYEASENLELAVVRGENWGKLGAADA